MSIVDPQELKNVLRPTVYAAAVGALLSRSVESQSGSRRDEGVMRAMPVAEPVSSSKHS